MLMAPEPDNPEDDLDPAVVGVVVGGGVAMVGTVATGVVLYLMTDDAVLRF